MYINIHKKRGGKKMNIEKYTLVELRQLAKERGIKNVSKLKKKN